MSLFLQDVFVITLLLNFVELAVGQRFDFSLFTSNLSTLDTVQDDATVNETLRLAGLLEFMLEHNQVVDSMCDSSRALGQLSDEVSGLQSIALIDGSCSQVAEDLSQNKNQTIMIIFSSTSTSINNGSVATGTFRTVPSDRAVPSSLGPLLREYNLRQLSVVSVQSPQHTELKRLLLNSLSLEPDESQLTVVEIDVNRNDQRVSAQALFDQQPHIYYLNTDLQTGVFFLCEGFTRSRYYPNYLWITPGWWNDVGGVTKWWENPLLLSTTSCTSANLRNTLNRSLVLSAVPTDNPGQDAPVFDTVSTGSRYSSTSYFVDAILSLALALNNSDSPQTITYSGLTDALASVTFYGATGFVQFSENGDRAGVQVAVQQFRTNGSESLTVVDIGTIQNGSYSSMLSDLEDSVFPDGPPPDGTPVKKNNTVVLAITVFVVLMCSVGLVLATVCLLFNIIFKERKIVKLTSPNLNYLLLSGVFILLLGMVFYIIPTTNESFLRAICTFRRFLVSFGHDVGFAVALIKTWRIHHIFKNPSPNKRAPKDWQLFVCAFLIVLVDLVISVILFIPDSIFHDVGLVKDRERSSTVNSQGVTVEYCAPSCGTTPYYLIWVGFTFIFKMALHVIAVILAFKIRNIKVDTLNDFKFTSAIVYTSTVLIVILVIILVGAANYKNIFAIMVPTLVFLEVLVFLLLSFVPKMVALYKDPKGAHVFNKPQKGSHSSLDAASGSLKRSAHLSNYASAKDSRRDSGRYTLDSKDKEKNNKTGNTKETKLDANGGKGLLVTDQHLADVWNEAKSKENASNNNINGINPETPDVLRGEETDV